MTPSYLPKVTDGESIRRRCARTEQSCSTCALVSRSDRGGVAYDVTATFAGGYWEKERVCDYMQREGKGSRRRTAIPVELVAEITRYGKTNASVDE
jgi:hypothetical protein